MKPALGTGHWQKEKGGLQPASCQPVPKSAERFARVLPYLGWMCKPGPGLNAAGQIGFACQSFQPRLSFLGSKFPATCH